MNNLPARLTDLAEGLADSADSAGFGDGAYMSFKKGDWMYGSEEQEVDLAGRWAINPEGFMHGWIGWGDKAHDTASEKLGEELTPATVPLSPEASLPAIQGEWSKQMAMQMLCLDGADEGVKVQFSSSSAGGMKFYATLVRAVVSKLNANDAKCCPVVLLGSDTYKHKEYGKIYNPTATIVDYVSVDDLKAEDAEPDPRENPAGAGEVVEEVVEDAKPPAITKKEAAAAEVVVPEVVEKPAATPQAEEPAAGDARPPPRRRRSRAAE